MSCAKKTEDLPVTHKMLNETERSLRHEITSVALAVQEVDRKLGEKTEFLDQKIDSKFDILNQKIDRLGSEVKHSMSSLELRMDAKLEKMLAEVRRIAISAEEQNMRNNYVMDQYQAVLIRQERFEEKQSVDLMKSKK